MFDTYFFTLTFDCINKKIFQNYIFVSDKTGLYPCNKV